MPTEAVYLPASCKLPPLMGYPDAKVSLARATAATGKLGDVSQESDLIKARCSTAS
jgi:hypothetical protein